MIPYSIISCKKLVISFFIIIPFIFYIYPFFLSYDKGDITLFFFGGVNITSDFFFFNVCNYLILGFLVYFSYSDTRYEIIISNNGSYIFDFLSILLFIVIFIGGFGYIHVFLYPLFFLIIGYKWPKNISFIIMIIIAICIMIINQDRYPVVFVLLLMFIKIITRLSVIKLVLFSFLAMFFMVFILQPIRAGIIPFSTDTFSSSKYILQHLSPIYIGAYKSNLIDFSIIDKLSEVIPLAKSMLGVTNMIDIVANETLPQSIIDSGTRLGSNSSAFFNTSGWVIIIICGLIIKSTLKFFKLRFFRNAVLLSLLVQGPYFIRRSFGSLFIDFIMMLFVAIFYCYIVQLYNKKHNIRG